MSAAPVELEGVWKSYPRWVGERTLRGVLTRRVPLAMRRGESVWALKDLTLRVEPGESVGLIGPNGAGKSTLLRLASGLGRPTRGRISVTEEVASILTLGDSFDLSLTGRENAITAGVVAGLRRAEARARLRDALEFAELEPFADAPMRTYSDGMKLRLAFGVVAQLRPRALIVDEVIAVGDLRFQAKCLERIRELRESGTAVLLASHALDQVESECERALWIQAGELRRQGDAESVVAEYADAMRSETMLRTPAPARHDDSPLELRRNRFGSQELEITRVSVPAEAESGAAFAISFDVVPTQQLEVVDPIASVTIHRVGDGVVCCDLSSEGAGVQLGQLGEEGLRVTLAVERLELAPGKYVVDVGVHGPRWEYAYDFHWQAYPLRVSGRSAGAGLMRPLHRWEAEPLAAAVAVERSALR